MALTRSASTRPSGTVAGTGAGQTIAIVEDGIDPTLEADLDTFDAYFDIPNPPSFQIINQTGRPRTPTSWPKPRSTSSGPTRSHPVRQSSFTTPITIRSSSDTLVDAMNTVSTMGVSVVTLSYGGPEIGLTDESALDSEFTTPGVTFLAASGDTGA